MFEVAFERPSIFIFKTLAARQCFALNWDDWTFSKKLWARGIVEIAHVPLKALEACCHDEEFSLKIPVISWESLTICKVIEASLPSQWNFRNVSIVRSNKSLQPWSSVNYVKIAEVFHGNSFMTQHNLKCLACNSVDPIDCNVSIPEQQTALSSRIRTIRECAPGRMARHPIERVH